MITRQKSKMEFLNCYVNIPRTNCEFLTEIECNKIILCLGAGLNKRDIARVHNFDVRIVNKWVQRFAKTGNGFLLFLFLAILSYNKGIRHHTNLYNFGVICINYFSKIFNSDY